MTTITLEAQLLCSISHYGSQELDDHTLIQALCEGAEWAMELFYQRHHTHIYALAYRMLHDVNAAEDITQDVFLTVWRKASLYSKQHGSVRVWLQAIVHHRGIDKVRSVAYRETQYLSLQKSDELEETKPGIDIPSQEPDVWEQAWEHEQAMLIRKMLAQLPPEQRQVIEYAYFEGYTHAEIAALWNLPLGTVKGRMRLALQKLRLLLSEYML